MAANIVPAICALAMTVMLASWLAKRWRLGVEMRCRCTEEDKNSTVDLHLAAAPNLLQAALGPLVVVGLLSLRPLCGIVIDPLVALPAGGLVSILVCGRWRDTVAYSEFGLSKVIGVSILLIGTGTIAGIVKGSGINADMIRILTACHLPVFALAPISSILLSGATASTTAGVTIASQTFSGALLQAGIPSVSAAAMLHAGGTIFDALPHGSFFHATAGAVGMSVKDRLKLFPFGTLVGATTTVVSTLVYLLFG